MLFEDPNIHINSWKVFNWSTTILWFEYGILKRKAKSFSDDWFAYIQFFFDQIHYSHEIFVLKYFCQIYVLSKLQLLNFLILKEFNFLMLVQLHSEKKKSLKNFTYENSDCKT